MTIPATVECGFCHGTGKVYAQGIACSRGRGGPGCQPFEVEFDCTPCKGTGQVEVDEKAGLDEILDEANETKEEP